MPDITLTVDSTAARNTLNAAPERVNAAMRGAMEDATTYTLAIVRRYPPERANQRYVRTGTLNKSWSRRISGSGLSIQGLIGSSGAMAPYNRYVKDRPHQASIHRGRHLTIQDVAEQEQNTVVHMFEDRLRAAGLDRP